MMKIGILLVGRASEDLVDEYGTYAEMLIALINTLGDQGVAALIIVFAVIFTYRKLLK